MKHVKPSATRPVRRIIATCASAEAVIFALANATLEFLGTRISQHAVLPAHRLWHRRYARRAGAVRARFAQMIAMWPLRARLALRSQNILQAVCRSARKTAIERSVSAIAIQRTKRATVKPASAKLATFARASASATPALHTIQNGRSAMHWLVMGGLPVGCASAKLAQCANPVLAYHATLESWTTHVKQHAIPSRV